MTSKKIYITLLCSLVLMFSMILLDMVETNMIFMDIKGGIAESMRKHLQNKGILIGSGNNKIRLVTHLGYGHEEGDLVINELKDFFN